jgi:H+/Na+-translocating ferredoxin:NAD+ oxidoreductase subunit B
MIIQILIMGLLALIVGFGLAYAARRFMEVGDSLYVQVRDILPGGNCGACGFAGCDDYARNLSKNHDLMGRCRPGGTRVMEKLCNILHEKKTEVKQSFSVLHCNGGNDCKDQGIYMGIKSCAGAATVAKGNKACHSGCLGFGDCVDACNFDAIRMGDGGLPLIDISKCTACGCCVSACPRNVISLHEKKGKLRFVGVGCNSHETGKHVMMKCQSGCIACGICEKNCPKGAITVKNCLAEIDYSLCIGCGICVEKCPKNVPKLI